MSSDSCLFRITYITHAFRLSHDKHAATKICTDRAKSGGTITRPPCMTIKMAAMSIALHIVVKETPGSPFPILWQIHNCFDCFMCKCKAHTVQHLPHFVAQNCNCTFHTFAHVIYVSKFWSTYATMAWKLHHFTFTPVHTLISEVHIDLDICFWVSTHRVIQGLSIIPFTLCCQQLFNNH